MDSGWVRRMTTRIIGTGSYVPEQIVTNDDLAKIVETNDEWIRSRTGIGERRIATEDSTSDMAARAARRAMESAGIGPEEIDLILLATSSPDYCFPNGACEVQGKIGAVNAACYDISAACTGFVFALNTAHAFISSGIYKTALVIGADVLSKLIDWKDRGTCVLFGDGAGAVVVQASETGILGVNMHSDGTKGGVLTCGSRTNGNFLLGKKPELGYMAMDGQEVFKFAVKKVPECINELLSDTGVSADEIRYFVIHQANYRIIESIAKRLKVSLDRFPVNMEHYGNTSGASVPLLLDEINQKGMLRPGDKIVFSGFGAGLTWGAALLEW
ncbi:MAG: ketoacyl-ACP synthase III [Clostridiales bacterium]|nr:ketoacyl-ACP synthase III [Clostridiales bacterium]